MCKDCIPVELPPVVWEMVLTLCEDFALALVGAPSESPERMTLKGTLMRIIQADGHGDGRSAAMMIAGYLDRIERRTGLGENEGRRIPIPYMVTTHGSMDN